MCFSFSWNQEHLTKPQREKSLREKARVGGRGRGSNWSLLAKGGRGGSISANRKKIQSSMFYVKFRYSIPKPRCNSNCWKCWKSPASAGIDLMLYSCLVSQVIAHWGTKSVNQASILWIQIQMPINFGRLHLNLNPGGQKLPQKYKKGKTFDILKCVMFSFDYWTL